MVLEMINMEARFDRLEQKLDKLADAMIKLIEHDTKLDGLVNHNVTQDKRLDTHSNRLDTNQSNITEVSNSVALNTNTSRTAERIFFICFTAAVSFIAYSARG